MLYSSFKFLQFGEIKNKKLKVVQTPPNLSPSFFKKYSKKVIKLLSLPLLYSFSFSQHPNIGSVKTFFSLSCMCLFLKKKKKKVISKWFWIFPCSLVSGYKGSDPIKWSGWRRKVGNSTRDVNSGSCRVKVGVFD